MFHHHHNHNHNHVFHQHPTEILCLVADNLHPRDHSALTLTNRHLACAVQPHLLSRLRTLPILDGTYSLLALHWAAASANLPVLRHLLEPIPDITVISSGIISPRTYTTAGLCPSTTWTWICAYCASLHLFLLHHRHSCWSYQGHTSTEYAITTHYDALLRLSFGACSTQGYAQHIVCHVAQRVSLYSLETILVLLREKFGDVVWETSRKSASPIVGRLRGGMSFFLRPRESVDARDSAGRTILHRVVRGMMLGEGGADMSHSECVRQLLIRGADVNVIDEDGVTALHVAAGMIDVTVVEMLLLGGADVDLTDADGCSSLHRALRAPENARWEVVDLLRVHGADFGVTDAAGVTVRELMDAPRALRSSARHRKV